MRKTLILAIALFVAWPAFAQAPTPIVITDKNGNTLTVTGATSGTQVGSPTPAVLTDKNGNALVLSSSGGGSGAGSVGVYIVATDAYPCTLIALPSNLCTQIHGDGRVFIDATTTLNGSTITTPTGNFTAADVGKSAWVTGQGIAAYKFTNGALVCPLSTISTVNSATSITLTTASDCTGAAQTATGTLVIGTKDGTALHALDAKIGCTAVYFPANAIILDDQSFLITPPACASPAGPTGTTGLPQPSAFGQSSNTQFIVTPDFNWASCTGAGAVSGGVCFGSALSQIWQFGFWGTGATSASNANCAGASGGKTFMATNNIGGAIYFVNAAGICVGQAGLVGAELNNLDEQWKEGGVQQVGIKACVNNAVGTVTESLYCSDNSVSGGVGLNVLANSSQFDTATYLYSNVTISGTLTSRGAQFCGGFGNSYAVTVNSGGVFNQDGDWVNQISGGGCTLVAGLNVASGGSHSFRNTKITASSNTITQAGVVIDECGNSVTGAGQVGSVTNPIFGNCSVQGKVTNGLVSNRNTTLTSTVLIPTTATWTGEAYAMLITLQAYDTAAGASCTTATTVAWTLSYLNATNTAETQTATETIATATGNGNATGGDPLRASFSIRMNGGNAVSYSTVVTPGANCVTVPSYSATFTVN